MLRLVIYRNEMISTTRYSKLFFSLHEVLHEAGIPERDGVVDCAQRNVTSSAKDLSPDSFSDEPFIKLVGAARYAPKILRAMSTLKVFHDIEIEVLGALFITGEEILNFDWVEKMRRCLYQKSFTARNAGVFLLDNLELYCSQIVMTPAYKKGILSEAEDVMDYGKIIQVIELSKIAYKDEFFRTDFLEKLENDLAHLAILASIGAPCNSRLLKTLTFSMV